MTTDLEAEYVARLFDKGYNELESAYSDKEWYATCTYDTQTSRFKFHLKHEKSHQSIVPSVWEKAHSIYNNLDVVVSPYLEDLPDVDGVDWPWEKFDAVIREASEYYQSRGLGSCIIIESITCRTGNGLRLQRHNTAVPIAPNLQKASEEFPLEIITASIVRGKKF